MSQNIHDTNVGLIKTQLESLVSDLDSNINSDFYLETKYQQLRETSPTLYKFVISQYKSRSFNKELFTKNMTMMLTNILKIQNNEMSQHDASVEVGEELALQFIPQYKK